MASFRRIERRRDGKESPSEQALQPLKLRVREDLGPDSQRPGQLVGQIIDPLILDGQLYGGIGSDGIDTALFEETVTVSGRGVPRFERCEDE